MLARALVLVTGAGIVLIAKLASAALTARLKAAPVRPHSPAQLQPRALV